MWRFQRIDPLSLFPAGACVALVGGGGKTSFMEHLAAAACRKGRKAVATTTTKIYADEPFALIGNLPPRPPADGQFLRVGRSVEENKLTGISFDDVKRLSTVYDLVLVEADGAKGRPLKCPSDHEPVVPPFADLTLVVAGLDGLYGLVDEKVFRWELFCALTGTVRDARVTPSVFLKFFENPTLLKGIKREKAVIVLNKYDALRDRAGAMPLAKAIIASTGIPVLVASVARGMFYAVGRAGE